MKKKRGNFYGGPGACGTLKFMTNISFAPSICIHRSIILIFIEKKYACQFFSPRKIHFFHDFLYSFPHFNDEFQALLSDLSVCSKTNEECQLSNSLN